MRIGIAIDERGYTLGQVVDAARAAADAGIRAFWMGQHADWDPLVALALAGREVPGIGVGTAIALTYPRHPLTLASGALSVQAATGNRFTLGVGLSHQPVIEDQYGYSYQRPARHLREYLSALGPLLRGETVEYQGETLRAKGVTAVAGAEPPSLLVAALGPALLRLAGGLADGTIINWAGPKVLDEHVVPTISAAAQAAGRPAPRVLARVMVSVTRDADGVRDWVAEHFGLAATLASYRAMLDRGGAAGVADTVVAGDASAVEAELQRMTDAGATEFVVLPTGSGEERARTIELLGSLTAERTRR
ncbi:MAG TPA: TIGR03564 family F420-dependent LLM class oxidoreductase [Trebonia sp.]|nr:TIGR03564 family F420-dependent LLM class oxidoreductase [Trebonia sp.]